MEKQKHFYTFVSKIQYSSLIKSKYGVDLGSTCCRFGSDLGSSGLDLGLIRDRFGRIFDSDRALVFAIFIFNTLDLSS